MTLGRLLYASLMAAPLAAAVAMPLGAPLAVAGTSPSRTLLRSLERFEQDMRRLDRTLPAATPTAAGADESPPAPAALEQLSAPPAGAIPNATGTVAIRQQVTLTLPQALELAVRNSPALAEQSAAVRERQGLKRSVQGRFWPELALELGGGYSQLRATNTVWTDNAGIYQAGSPFLVQPNGWQRIQSNLGLGAAGLGLRWDLVNFERGAALAESSQELEAAEQRYADGLRQLQLDVSLAYYGLQLAEQLRRVRQAVVDSDTVVRDEVQALKRSGLVPRLDLLRAEAELQQSRYRLEQADALRLSRQRQLSNLLNAPFAITLTAPEAVRLQPPWPLDLERTLIAGFRDNPQLQALQAARAALLRQADRRAAELLPSLRLYARGGLADGLSTKPVIDLNGCCGAANIPALNSQTNEWAAGLELRWRLFDAGVTSGAVSASKAAAERTEQALARERNGIRQRMETAFYDHRAALGQIVASRAAYAAAREAFRDVRARYQLGLADYTDVSDTIRQLTQAMEGVAESVTLANVSYAQLLRELLPVPTQPTAPVSLPLVLPAPLSAAASPAP